MNDKHNENYSVITELLQHFDAKGDVDTAYKLGYVASMLAQAMCESPKAREYVKNHVEYVKGE
jgi:hypothetical protein